MAQAWYLTSETAKNKQDGASFLSLVLHFLKSSWFHDLLSLPKLFLHLIQQVFVDFHFPTSPCLSLPCQKVIHVLSVKSDSFLFILWIMTFDAHLDKGFWWKGTLPGDWDSLGKWCGEFKPIRTKVQRGFSFLTAQTRAWGNTVAQNTISPPFLRI